MNKAVIFPRKTENQVFELICIWARQRQENLSGQIFLYLSKASAFCSHGGLALFSDLTEKIKDHLISGQSVQKLVTLMH